MIAALAVNEGTVLLAIVIAVPILFVLVLLAVGLYYEYTDPGWDTHERESGR